MQEIQVTGILTHHSNKQEINIERKKTKEGIRWKEREAGGR